MDKKYKQYLEFSWKDSAEWQSYYTNLYPTPPGKMIEKYKKKFFKLKIDPDFDVNYDPSTEQQQQQQQQQQQSSSSYYRPSYSSSAPSSPSALLNLETLIMLLFAISLPFNFHPTKIAAVAYLMRSFRQCGMPQWNTQYAQLIFTNDSFHLLVYSLLLLVDRFNYYLALPIGMKMLVDIAENLKVMNISALKAFMKYIDMIITKRHEIITCKGHVEVAIGFMMIIGILLKVNSFILPIAYWQLMKMKYLMSPEVKYSWVVLNQYADNIKRNPSLPAIAVTVIDKIQWAFAYMGKVDTQQQQQQSNQQAGSEQEANSSGGLGGCQVF